MCNVEAITRSGMLEEVTINNEACRHALVVGRPSGMYFWWKTAISIIIQG